MNEEKLTKEELTKEEKLMRDEKRQENAEKDRRTAWIVFLLIVMVLLTLSLVASVFYGFIGKGLLMKPEDLLIEVNIWVNPPTDSGETTPPESGSDETKPIEPDETDPPETGSTDTEPPETEPDDTKPGDPEEEPTPNVITGTTGGDDWTSTTRIDLFRLSYDNSTGDPTVVSSDSSRVIAPGTSGMYAFDIRNIGNIGVDYTVYVTTTVTTEAGGHSFTVPTLARMRTDDGDYVFGSNSAYVNIADSNGVTHSGELGEFRYARYIFEWQWPYEGNDELDTLLGNLAAAGEQIVVDVQLMIRATANASAVAGKLIP